MQNVDISVFACAMTCSFFREWFRCIQAVMNHNGLNQNEKYVYLWLCAHCATLRNHTCSFSYEQLSRMLNQSTKMVHGALLTLKIIGFLKADIPLYFEELSPEMEKTIRVLQPQYVLKENFFLRETVKQEQPVMQTYDKRPLSINLLMRKIQKGAPSKHKRSSAYAPNAD